MTSKLELKLPKWICSYLRLFDSSFSQQCDWKTKNAYVFHFSDIHLFPLLVFMFSSADNDILYQRQQASPDEFVSRPVRAIALCIPSVHHFRRKMHAHIREQKICSFFSASKKNFHRHVIGFGDIPFISIVCNRAKSSKRLFHTISNLGNAALNLRRWELPAWLQT